MTTQKQEKPSAVRGAKQGGESQRPLWVEAAAWTDRMLEALERGVQGGVWFALIDKVYRVKNLEAAYERVKENGGSAGVDHVSVEDFGKNLERELKKLSAGIQEGTYRPQSVKRVHIPKAGGGKRPLGIPTVRDRVVQAAVRQVIEPIFEHEFLNCSYGFRPNRGCKDALRVVDELLEQKRIVVEADIKGFFDMISHDKLMKFVGQRIQDSRILNLLELLLKQGIVEQGEEFDPAREGTPQGGVISPLLANVYLHVLDVALTEQGYNLVRYADDFVVLCETEEEGARAKESITKVMESIELELHPTKTQVVDMRQIGASFEFLGYRFKNHKGEFLRYPRHKSIMKLRDSIRRLTPRLSGAKMEEIIVRVNQTLKGWYEYFKHSSRNAFPAHDSWVRMRLRAILSRRNRCCSRRYGSTHKRWQNSYFTDLGLFCASAKHKSERFQPACR